MKHLLPTMGLCLLGPLICVSPARAANDDSEPAVVKAVEVLGSALHLKPARNVSLRKSGTIATLKACMKVPDTDTRAVFTGTYNARSVYLVLVRGETSGVHVILGRDCSSAIAAPPVAAVALSYAAQGAIKGGGSVMALKAFVPVSRPADPGTPAPDEKKPNTILAYKTDFGRVVVSADAATGTGSTEVTSDRGQIIYNETFEFRP